MRSPTENGLSQPLVDHVESFLAEHGALDGCLVVGFSGGPDSTALLWALTRVARRHPLSLVAAHLDHGLDPESAARARHSERVAATLGVRYASERTRPDVRREGVEAAARRVRYRFLRRCRETFGARHIVVGHHQDDQVATILLRLLFGSGVSGLGGMRDAEGDLLRPLLGIPRSALSAALEATGLPAVDDPGNRDPDRPRNQVETRLVPWLRAREGAAGQLLATAAAARGASAALRARLSRTLAIRATDEPAGARLDLGALRRLPPDLRPYALDALRRAAGARYPAPRRARRELDRQLAAGGAIACHCGAGWAWRAAGGRLELHRLGRREVPEFSYTLRVPGEVSIPEVGLTLLVKEAVQAPWMFQGSKSRAAMSLPLEVGQQVLIRNRRPGDRVRPLGCTHQRKLKDVLIDRQVARSERDALPLLVVDDRIAWVPGVTIDDAYRLDGNRRTWLAVLSPMRVAPRP